MNTPFPPHVARVTVLRHSKSHPETVVAALFHLFAFSRSNLPLLLRTLISLVLSHLHYSLSRSQLRIILSLARRAFPQGKFVNIQKHFGGGAGHLH